MGQLDNKVAVVTGGGTRLGRAISIALAREGANLALVGRTLSALLETQERIQTTTGQKVFIGSYDISKADQARMFAMEVEKAFGQVNILVNNAAGWLSGTLVDADENEINETIDTTIKGPIWLCRLFWEQLKSSSPGYIINITTLGARPSRSNATPIYVAAKYGLAGFTDALRRLAIKDNILVTEILPGSVASEFDIDDPEEKIVGKYGNARATPRDITEAVVFSLTRSKNGMVEEISIPAVGDWFEDWSRY